MKAELIIFDLDGTLVDSKGDIVKAVNFTLKKLSLEERAAKEIISFIGTGVRDLLKRSLPEDKSNSLKQAVKIFEDYYKQHPADESRLYPGVKEVLEYFKDTKMLIVTNRTKKMADATLKEFSIDQYFQDVIGGDDENCLKPSACPLKKGMERFIKDPKKTIFIGDMDLDVKAGKEAGVKTCAVTYGIGEKKDIERSQPDFIINDIIELKRIIEKNG